MIVDPLFSIDSTYVRPSHREFVAERLALELTRLADPRHLVEHVLRPTEFDWDFEPIGPGFLDLATPFMARPSGSAALFHAMLEEYGIESTGARHAVVLLEYVHFATRMSDHFDYHDAFAEATPDAATAERLVQLRYAAQWLNNYPRWLITSNQLEATPAARIHMHRWGHQSFTSTGVARSCFVSFAHRGFRGVTRDNWLAIAPGLLCELVISPAVMATVLANRGEAELAVVKRAFSHLAVALKARLERRNSIDGFSAPEAPESDAALPWNFPGVAVIAAAPNLELSALSGSRFPRIAATVTALANAPGVATQASIEHARALELEHASIFASTLQSAGILPRAAVELSRAFGRE